MIRDAQIPDRQRPAPAAGRYAGLQKPPGAAHSVLPARIGDDRRLSDPDLRVALALASMLDRYGEASSASVKQIMLVTDMARATVFRCLKALEAAGWMRREARYHPYSGAALSNAYLINFHNTIPADCDRLVAFSRRRGLRQRPAIPSFCGDDGTVPPETAESPPRLADETGVVTPGSPPSLTDETGVVTAESSPSLTGETDPVSPVRPLKEGILPIRTSHQESSPSLAMAMAMAGDAARATDPGGQDPGSVDGGMAKAMAMAGKTVAGSNAAEPPAAPAGARASSGPPGLEAQELAREFAFVRLNFYPHANRKPPPKAAERIQDWIDRGAGQTLISEVMWEQMRRLHEAGKPCPASPAIFDPDIELALDQQRRAQAQAARQAVAVNPWHALDTQLRQKLRQAHRDTSGLIALRKTAERAGLAPGDVAGLFETTGAWHTADPVYTVQAEIGRQARAISGTDLPGNGIQ